MHSGGYFLKDLDDGLLQVYQNNDFGFEIQNKGNPSSMQTFRTVLYHSHAADKKKEKCTKLR